MGLQITSHVLMVRPARFAANLQTQTSNQFQDRLATVDEQHAQQLAQEEFDALASALATAGVHVHVFEDAAEPRKPDAVFPNNWVSFHASGAAVLYPMLAPNRRLERREDLLQALSAKHGFRISRVVDLTPHENEGRFLEGTGSLVLDRANRIAYACLSPRTDLQVLGEFGQQLDYEIVAFEAVDQSGAAIYHTNVMMCIGERFAAVCAESIAAAERQAVVKSLQNTHQAIIDLSFDQMIRFAGNMLELSTASGASVVAMSECARECLTPAQRAAIEAHAGPIVSAAIPTIERLGGGSVRCMLAEIFLPRKGDQV